MTTRPGGCVLDAMRMQRAQRIVTLTKVVRQDGFVLRMSDHDRDITFEGETYQSTILGAYSADRREAGLRTGNQEVRGVADGVSITIPDLKGNLYRGAEVQQIVTDPSAPWKVSARHRRFVRSIVQSGKWWTATLEARSQGLTRPSGGKLGGTFWPTCKKQLGDMTPGVGCGKDVSIGTGFSGAGARVASIVAQRLTVQMVVGTWPGSFTDDYFRDGSFEWVWAATDGQGQVTATTTDTTITHAGAGWATDVHAGKYARILSGSGGYVQGTSWARIVSNTATVLTFESTAAMAGFGAGTFYDVCQEAANHGVVSPIVGYTHSTREITLLLKTPKDIAVGDSGIWRAGCDGLRQTCIDKFSNVVNFGGHDVFAPNGQEIIEPAGEL